MFDIGFSELLLIAVVGIVVIGPKDLPVVVRHVAKFLRELRGAYGG
jgi:sec-independent protein translocase protein TatB